MARTFKWRVERDISPTGDFKVKEASFGDGYKQITSDGINNKDESYGIKTHGQEPVIIKIKEFMDDHKGVYSFFWTPPLGTLSLFTCADPKYVPQGGGLWVFTGTFVRSYSSTGGLSG